MSHQVSAEAMEDFITVMQLYSAYMDFLLGKVEAGTYDVDQDGDSCPELCVRFVNQYLFCHRRHGDGFLSLAYERLLPLWESNLGRPFSQMETMGQIAIYLADFHVVRRLVSTRECLELEGIYARCLALHRSNKGS